MRDSARLFLRQHCGLPALFFLLLGVFATDSAGASTNVTFVAPTAEELAMTSVPGYPGLPAVVLNREEITQDTDGLALHYVRIKVLTEEGKKYANVELNFVHGKDNKKITDITARTIHADGKILTFTGEPYEKVVEKAHGFKRQQTVFTLPEVEVGSILEYSFIEHYARFVEPPTFDIQGDLYIKHAHFVWNPVREVRGEHTMLKTISFYPVLPPGVVVEAHETAYTGVFDLGHHKRQTYEVTVADVPPTPDEEFSPPLSSVQYSVRFSYASAPEEKFWGAEGKYWSKEIDSFISQNDKVDAATKQIVAGAATQEEKLRRIYAAVMTFENTDYTRDRNKSENKAEGHGKIKSAADVLELKHGTSTALTLLFLAMARSAGLDAYAMWVPDRTEDIFASRWLSFSQFSDVIAIVTVDGKERFFDPGARYCPFGQLAWWHTLVQGLRQSSTGAVLDHTPGTASSANVTKREAVLSLDAEGNATGTVRMTFVGAAALHWRRAALLSDHEEFLRKMREEVVSRMPGSMEIDLDAVNHLEDYEEPLELLAHVKGKFASTAGKRYLVAADPFVALKPPVFPHPERRLPIDFYYPEIVDDRVEMKLPSQLVVEAAASSEEFKLAGKGRYMLSVGSTDSGFTTHREFVFDEVFMPVSDYPGLRDFYAKLEAKDKESVVLKASTARR